MDELVGYLQGADEERSSENAPTSAPLAEYPNLRREECFDDKNISSYSTMSEGSTPPEWSCYEEQSILLMPLRTLMKTEHSEAGSSSVEYTRNDHLKAEGAHVLTEIETGVVVGGNTPFCNVSTKDSGEVDPSKRMLDHLECNAQEQVERQLPETSKEASKT